MPERGAESWHLDRRVPVAIILAIALQTAGAVFWFGQLSTRVDTIENWISDNRRIDARLSVLEANTTEIRRILERIETSQERGSP